MSGIINEFKAFVMKGNVVDLAVGVIIGAAFGKIVTSVVEDLLMPLVGSVAQADFSNLYVGLSQAVTEAAAKGPLALAEARKIGPVFAYGNFLTILLNFIIVAFCIFTMIKAINKLNKLNKLNKKADEAASAPPEPPAELVLLTEIRDLLKKK